ncbi:MAG: hypothetical protein EOP11_05725 [Proteobacteria bacterium]|nr:MAG: hypothetical protein EOP11_05725 [Pseudomonadota bacterium]
MDKDAGASSQAISFHRAIGASADAIYAAWTSPFLIERWMANRAESDLRLGGSYRYEIPGPEGVTFVHHGTFLMLEPGRLIRQTFAIETEEENLFEGEFIELRLTALDAGRTEILFTNGWAAPLIEDEDLSAVEANWQAWFDQLEKFLGLAPPRALNAASQTLHILREFPAMPNEVFDAWIRPELASQWLFTSGDASATVSLDPRPGGSWAISNAREGTDYRAEGKYLMVDRPHHLAFTFSMPQFSPNQDEITVDIYQSGAATLLNFTQSGPDIAEELAHVPAGGTGGSEAGWQSMFDALEKAIFLASREGLR